MVRKTQQFDVDRRRISVSNLDKVLYPGERYTKADVIDYYVRVSKYLLPQLRNGPVTLKRFRDGVFGEFFYEKDAPAFTPSWIKTVLVPRRETHGPDIRYIMINDRATLVGWPTSQISRSILSFIARHDWTARNTRVVSAKRDDESA